MKIKFLSLIIAASLVAACGDKPGTTDNNKPSLSDLKSPEAVKKAAESTMSKGDPSKPLTDYRELTSGNDLMFLYQAMLNLPIDYEKISEIYSEDYRRTNDAFKKQDIVKALKDRINSQVEAAKNSRYIVWTISSPYSPLLNSYEMQSKSFPIKGLGEGSYYYYSDNASSYHLAFSNVGQFKSIAVPDETKAREIEGLISKNRGMTMKVYAFVQDADPSNTTVKAEIMKIQVTGINGEAIY